MNDDQSEVSYVSRFLTKFVEIIAAGLATAVSAYVVAHLVGPPSAVAPAPAVSTAPSAAPAQQPVAAAALATAPAATVTGEQHPAAQAPSAIPPRQPPAATPTQQSAGAAPPPQPGRKAERAASASASAPKDTKDAAAKDNKPSGARGEKSAEALARAALANLDAERGPVAPPPRQVDIPQQAPPVAPAPVETQPRNTAVVGPTSNPAPAAETAAPPPERPVEEEYGVFAAFKHVPDLLRPNSSPPAADAPRPPLPVGDSTPE